MEKSQAVDIYTVYKNKLIASINLHRQHAQQYLAFVTAILVATIAGTTKVDELGPFSFLLVVGPLLNILLSILAIKMCDRFYEGFLEDVTVTAKLENEIGLSKNSQLQDGHAFSQDTTFVPKRWIADMQKYDHSEDFIGDKMKAGSNKVNRITFMFLAIGNGLLAISLLFLILRHIASSQVN